MNKAAHISKIAEEFNSNINYSRTSNEELRRLYRDAFSSEERAMFPTCALREEYAVYAKQSAHKLLDLCLSIIIDFCERVKKGKRSADFYLHTARYATEFATADQAKLIDLPGAGGPYIHLAVFHAWSAGRYLLERGEELPATAAAIAMSDDESDAALEALEA